MNGSVLFCGLLFIAVCLADKEHERHGAHSPLKEKHYDEHGEHNPDYDHQAILGSRKEDDEYEELEPEEAKLRLSKLIPHMDNNNDRFIDKEELRDWILKSFKSLDEEEASEAFDEHDENHDDHVEWNEYLDKQYNYKPKDIEDFRQHPSKEHQETLEMIDDDKLKFAAADLNKDGRLSREEYFAFVHPYDYEYMHQVELDRVTRSQDKDKDGYITWKEYLGDREPDKEMESWEKKHFDDFDKNKDGRLDREEMIGWVLPDNKEVANEEVEHLMKEGDANEDGKLSFDEILDKTETFVGSQATDYGRQLHEEL